MYVENCETKLQQRTGAARKYSSEHLRAHIKSNNRKGSGSTIYGLQLHTVIALITTLNYPKLSLFGVYLQYPN